MTPAYARADVILTAGESVTFQFNSLVAFPDEYGPGIGDYQLGGYQPSSFLLIDIGPGTFSAVLSAYDPDTTVAPFDVISLVEGRLGTGELVR